MAHRIENRVLESSTSTGTGPMTLGGAIAGFRTFASKLANADTCSYFIMAVNASGNPTGDWEVGKGTFSGGVLTRTTVRDSSNAGAAVVFAAGTKHIGITMLAPNSVDVADEWFKAIVGGFPTLASAQQSGFYEAVAGGLLQISGTTDITGLGNTAPPGFMRSARLLSDLNIINSASMECPGGVNIIGKAGDFVTFLCKTPGNWCVVDYVRFSERPLDVEAIGTMSSAGTMAVGTAIAKTINVTGTNPISGFTGGVNGMVRTLRFSGTCRLVTSANFRLPGDLDYTAEANDVLVFIAESATVWKCLYATRGDATPVLERPSTMRNYIDNGDMVLDQRGLGGAASLTPGIYMRDRWAFGSSGTKLGVSAFNTVNTPQNGSRGFFQNAIRMSVSSPGALAAGDFFVISQGIEGFRLREFAFGAAAGANQRLTLSFWARAGLVGTYTASFRSSGTTRSYLAPFSINAANTWEYKTITIPVDTAGTWASLNSSNAALNVSFAGSAGSTYSSTTVNAWQNGNYTGITGAVNLAQTGGYLDITGVQLEEGIRPTPFAFLSFDQSMRACKRFFHTTYAYGNAIGSTGDLASCATGIGLSADVVLAMHEWPVIMRVGPSCVIYNGSTGAASNCRDSVTGANAALSGGLSSSARKPYAFSAAGQITVGRTYDFHITATADI